MSLLTRPLAGAKALMLFALAFALLPFHRFFRRGKPPIWLVSERPDEARDNGYHFFRYCMGAGVPKDVRYVISRGSVDRARVEEIGPLVTWGSLGHHLTWLAAECLISAHAGNCAPDSWVAWRLRKLGVARQRVVNLRHGVIGSSLPDFMASGRWDLVVTASARERDFLVGHVGHPPGSVVVTGLPRFDALHQPVKIRNQILLMPTWRRWLNPPGGSVPASHDEAVRTSEWYTAFHGLLSDPKLHEVLSDHEWRLVFYPHYGAQPFLHLFDGLPACIVLASRHDFDVQQLLMESKVLVTDFSSVSFDFAYMRKPVVYLLPDEERYFADHFQRGYFDFERDGFGPAHRDPMATVQSLIRLIQSEARTADQFKTRIDNFFGFHDTDNSRRVLEATLRVCDTGYPPYGSLAQKAVPTRVPFSDMRYRDGGNR